MSKKSLGIARIGLALGLFVLGRPNDAIALEWFGNDLRDRPSAQTCWSPDPAIFPSPSDKVAMRSSSTQSGPHSELYVPSDWFESDVVEIASWPDYDNDMCRRFRSP